MKRNRISNPPERPGKQRAVPAKPELLAPAGSPATWAAAVEAGADAVYMGLKSFSARAYASNFTPTEMARVVDLSHERGVKVYVAFNVMIKETELRDAARALDALTVIKPDALIVQDLGLLHLIKKHFPQFEVHASTLTAVHNLPGLLVLERLGFERAVLARELTLREVEHLAARSPIGVEMFIHGALCFSFSGLCLMSSFLGGRGSLRGACTQPCRRVYTTGKKKGYFFSPTDLDTSEWMLKIRSLPLSALKIEGRMKGADYVSRVVRAYRMLLDVPEDDFDTVFREAEELIRMSPGRRRSAGFLPGVSAPEALAPTLTATSGVYLGRVKAVSGRAATVELQEEAALGDRLRVQFRQGGEQKAFTLKEMKVEGRPAEKVEPDREAVLTAPFEVSPGDLLFRVESAEVEQEASASPLVKKVQAAGRATELKPGPALKRVLADLEGPKTRRSSPHRAVSSKLQLWYKVSRTEDVAGLAELKPDRVILPADSVNVRRMVNYRRRLGDLFNRIVWSLPPLVFDAGLAALNRDLTQLARMGAREFAIANPGQLALVDREIKGRRGRPIVYADYRVNCLNSQAEAELADMGLAGVTISLEADEANLEALLAKAGPLPRMLYLYGRPALFTSRFRPAGPRENLPVVSPRRERFRIRETRDYVTIFSEQPVFLAPLLKKKAPAGVTAFIVDLENDPRPAATARVVHEAVARGKPIGGASRFNYSRGLF